MIFYRMNLLPLIRCKSAFVPPDGGIIAGTPSEKRMPPKKKIKQEQVLAICVTPLWLPLKEENDQVLLALHLTQSRTSTSS
jgi:hypothetical protein